MFSYYIRLGACKIEGDMVIFTNLFQRLFIPLDLFRGSRVS